MSRYDEVRFEFLPNQPPDTKVGEWRARLANHFGMGPTIEDALYDMAAKIDREVKAVERARVSLRDTKVPRR